MRLERYSRTSDSPRAVAGTASLAALGLALVPLEVRAQNDEPSAEAAARGNTIFVTARKREESLLEVPESVVAIGAEDIQRQNIKSLNQIGQNVPNLNLSMRTDGFPNVSIRGVGAFGLTQGVGFYLDDVQLFGDASSRFGDLARIEVLKGPQGVLYGGSNIGGAVKYVSERPDPDRVSGRVKLLAGEQNVFDGEAAINLPLSPNWALRVFGFGRTDDGFLYNPNSPSPVFGVTYDQPRDVGAYEEFGGRVAIAGDLTDSFSLHASARYNEYDGPANNWSRELGGEGDFTYPKALDVNRNPKNVRKTFGANLELKLDLGNVLVTSISSYTDSKSDRVTDVDLTQLWAFNTIQPQTFEVSTQELRFTSTGDGPLQWIAGLYARDLKETMNSTLEFGWIFIEADDPFAFVTVPFVTSEENKNNAAAFGNVTYELGNIELGAGLRVDRWRSQECALDVGHCASKSETEVLPRLSLTFDLNEDAIVYATYSKGFEPGGWNGIADGAPLIFGPDGEPTLVGYDPERSAQYEVGVKSEIFGGMGSVTAAAFYTTYKNRQFEFIVPNPGGDGLIEGITNVGDSTQRGLELSASMTPADYLTLSGAFGLVEAEWDDGTVLIDGLDLSGQTPPNVIGTSANFNANLALPLSDELDFIADLQVSYKGKMKGGKPWNNVENPSYTVVDIQTGFVRGPWELLLNVQNVFDEEYYTDLEPFPNFGIDGLTGTGPETFIIGTLGHPRIVTASVSYKF